MGLFSGSKTVNRGYDIVPLKDNIKLQDNLWKNSKLRLNKAFMDGGVEAYSKLSFNMYKKISRKYSTEYLQKAGVVTNNTFKMIEFNKDVLRTLLKETTGNSNLELLHYEINNPNTTLDNLQFLLGSLLKVPCSVEPKNTNDNATVYNFIIVDGDLDKNLFTQTDPDKTILTITRSGDNSYDTAEHPLPVAYEKLNIVSLTGSMHPQDVLRFMQNNKNALSFYWLQSAANLANTIENGSLVKTLSTSTSDNINEITITDNNNNVISKGFTNKIFNNIDAILTMNGKARATDDNISLSSQTEDSDTCPKNTLTTGVNVTTEKNYYTIPEPIEETKTITICGIEYEYKATYTIVGDKNTIVTTTTTTTYTSGTRAETVVTETTDDDGNTTTTETTAIINTCTKNERVVVVVEYEPINYVITIQITQPLLKCYPNIDYKIRPTITTDAYFNYMALDTDKIKIKDFINNHTIVVSHKDFDGINIIDKTISLTGTSFDVNKVEQILIQKDAIHHENGWEYTNVVGPSVSVHEANDFKFNVGLFFNKTPQEAFNTGIITLTGADSFGLYVKISLIITSDMYLISTNNLLTPVIPLRYADDVLYSRSKEGKAIKYAIDNLKNIVISIKQYSFYLDPYSMEWTSNYPRTDQEEDMKIIQDIIETIAGSINEVHNIIKDNEEVLKEITEAIAEKNPPSIDDILTHLSSSDNFEKADKKTKKLQHILSPMGIPKSGLDGLIDTVSTNDNIYTAAIFSGLRLFNEDNTLITDSTNVRAKVLHLFADIMTINNIVLNTPQTFSISNYVINATYTYTIEKSIITNFKTTNEYILATKGSKLNNKYFMHTSYEVIKTVDDGYTAWYIRNQIIYTYKINRDGSATRFKFINIQMHLTSYDGEYEVNTGDSYKTDLWNETIKVIPRTDLHKLIIVYPESINKKLSFHEYSNLYNDNLFLFVYSRKVTHTKWYQSSFFGFILVVAAMVVIAATGQFELLSGLSTLQAGILTTVELTAFSYGIGLMFPNMPMAMKIAMQVAMVIATRNPQVAANIGSTTSEAATTITMESIVNSIETYFTDMSTMDMITFTASKLNTAYSIYIKEKLESEADSARKFIAAATEATEKLDNKLKEFDVQKERVSIFASFMLDFIEAETYDQLAVSEMYMSNEFNASLLDYISSTEYQSDIAKIPNLPITDVMV